MAKPWNRCPSTHCERRQECTSPSDCAAKGAGRRLYGLLTPSGTIVPMGRVKPVLSKADKADFWKVVRI